MSETLLASAPGLSQPLGPRLLAAGVHAGLITAAVLGTTRARVYSAPAQVDTIDLLVHEASPVRSVPPTSTPVLPDLPSVSPGGEMPLPDLGLPLEVQSGKPVDLADVLDRISPPGTPLGDAYGPTQDTGRILLAAEVDEPITVIRQGIPKYPRVLEALGISGRVVVEFVVDTAGAVEVNSLRVVRSSAPGFEAAAVEAIRETRFTPARARGRLVRQLASQAVNFTAR